ncbi:hypothetical protein G7046_g5806 [Stylonectria norvegica]|nr:hypothetical protein G7046_g5806 [Stylonectria norvegica]
MASIQTELPLRGKPELATFGKAMQNEFLFTPGWKNLNHGSFGTYPKAIRDKFRAYQDASEARPDEFIRYEYGKLLDESRAAVAAIINAPVETVVFVSNATVGVNTVFRNIVWNPDGKDVIISFSTVYEACRKVGDYLEDCSPVKVSTHGIDITYPIDDDEIIKRFRDAVAQLEAQGKRARIAIFDVVSSRPGTVFPWETLVETCRELGVLSMVDGAQGIGMVKLDIAAVNPDFFVSNCHKWLHVPRGCAVFHVPVRNQHLIVTSLATSHGYVPLTKARISPLPPNPKGPFVANFEFVGTVDNSPYLCVKDAIAWRKDVLGGEERILAYLWALNKKGSQIIADALQTPVMENSTGTLRNCAMANVALPLWVGEKGEGAAEGDAVLTKEEAATALQWMLRVMIDDYKTFLSLFEHGGRFWIRVSAQVYVEEADYVWCAGMLKELSERVAKREFKK